MNQSLLLDYTIYKSLIELYGYNLKRIDLDCVASFQYIIRHWIHLYD